jgi:TRAP-type C4-dicarboxylate transport system permease large subunit
MLISVKEMFNSGSTSFHWPRLLFILAGNIMETGGISPPPAEFAKSLVGGVQGTRR